MIVLWSVLSSKHSISTADHKNELTTVRRRPIGEDVFAHFVVIVKGRSDVQRLVVMLIEYLVPSITRAPHSHQAPNELLPRVFASKDRRRNSVENSASFVAREVVVFGLGRLEMFFGVLDVSYEVQVVDWVKSDQFPKARLVVV